MRWAGFSTRMFKRRHAASWLLLAGVSSAGVTMADQNDAALERLFAELAASQSVAEAARYESEIWARWLMSGSEAVDRDLARGMSAMDQGDARAAMAAFNAVVAAAPDFAEGWNKRATLHWMMGNFAESISDIDRTLALESRHFGALSGLSMIRESQHRPFEALEALEKVIAIHPKLPQLQPRIDHLTRQLGESI
jgi:tetratricopeptide (TPR) repeat protein